jgi:hypothetical protein
MVKVGCAQNDVASSSKNDSKTTDDNVANKDAAPGTDEFDAPVGIVVDS